jgi:hypothetical protein
VPHPHANVISADAFARGIIRSETDYVVYTKGLGRSMDGLDFAFYRGRSKYHTKYDSIPGMAGGEKALWAMMESVRGAGDTLVNSVDQENGPSDEKAVYFDCKLLFRFCPISGLNHRLCSVWRHADCVLPSGVYHHQHAPSYLGAFSSDFPRCYAVTDSIQSAPP